MTDNPSGPVSRVRRHWPVVVLAVCVVLAAVIGGSLGYFLRLDLPDVRALEDYAPPVMSRVVANDGELVDTFAEQRRMLIEYRDIPQSFKDALIATEDAKFLEHTGVDVQGIFRAAWSDLRNMSLEQGASTLTMQLARTLFLHRQKTIQRKLQEMVLALEIERNYTKEEILRFYSNQVYMGHGRYGLEAASRHYFGKPARELSLSEAATLAGVIQRPESITPYRNMERAVSRRNHVLNRMVQVGYLSPEDAAITRDEPIVLASERSRELLAPYFVEEVRRWLKGKYGDSGVYQEGLAVRTTLDPELQRIANDAVDLGLRQLDRRQGWRGVEDRVPEGEDLATWVSPAWSEPLAEGGVTDGIVQTVSGDGLDVRVASLRGTLDTEDLAWARISDPAAAFRTGDIVRVRLVSITEDGTADLALEQRPAVEAALVALDPRSGAIRAMVGGFDFARSEFNRATQAKRQTGSAFKPFVFTAALANGWTLADTIVDEPTVFLDPGTVEPYQPENYSNKYYGRLTLRRAMEKSANIATVKLLDAVGYEETIAVARRLGITSPLQPYPSLALGSFEISLLELTAAYGAFANQGVRVEPHLIEEVRDRQGNLLLRYEPEIHDAVTPQIAFLMNRALEGVITDGTGRAAKSIDRPLAGKTGTTDDNTDAWFVGYTPDLAVGVWVGFDMKKSLGSRETGALAALPIWKHFMENSTRNRPAIEFDRPPEIRVASVDRSTGLKNNPAAGCGGVFSEVFVAGTEPTAYCSAAAHRQLHMPYTLQRYDLDERGRLRIPRADLDALLATDLTLSLSPGGRELLARTPEGTMRIEIDPIPGGETVAIPTRILERARPEEWVGRDGRRARVVLLGNPGSR